MSERHDPDVTLPWMRDGTRRFLAAVESLEDHEFAHPSGLPGWSRAHVIGHVAGNADALIRLTSWADTGVECPMYESREQRNSEIESTAAMTPDELRRLSVDTAAALDRALAGLDERGWTATVRSALGRVIPAAEIPWMRIREVWLHAIDIGGAVELGSFPPGIVDLLLDDTVAALSARDGCPSLILAPADRARTWVLGPEQENGPVLDLPAAVLAGWTTGRSSPADLPALPSWI